MGRQSRCGTCGGSSKEHTLTGKEDCRECGGHGFVYDDDNVDKNEIDWDEEEVTWRHGQRTIRRIDPNS